MPDKSRRYSFRTRAVAILAIVAGILFIEAGAKYILYYRGLHRSYELTKKYYNFQGDFWSFKKRYEQTQSHSIGSSSPIITDIYNRRYYLPAVTGHDQGMYLKPKTPLPAEGVVRILCIGTSTTEVGYPEQLQQVLDARNPGKYEVIIAGIPGSTMIHFHMNYSMIWRDLGAQIVIIENPVDELLMNNIPFAISDDFAKPIEDPLMFASRRPPWRLFSGLNKMIELSRTERAEHPSPDSATRFRTILTALAAEVRGAGATPILLTYQTSLSSEDMQGEYSQEFLEGIYAFYSGFFYNFTIAGALEAIENQNDIMHEIASEDGILLIDTMGMLPRQDKYFLDGNHHTDLGDELIAQRVAEVLLENESGSR